MSLDRFVQFYRSLNRSDDHSSARISGTLFCSKENVSLIQSLSKDKNIGRFEEIFLGGKDIEVDELTELDANIDVCYSLSTSGESNVYFNITSFIESDKNLCFGVFPRNFYIIDDNYYSEEESIDVKYQLIEKICNLIRNLSELAHYHDRKNEGINYTLVFVNESEIANSRPVVFKPTITSDMLDVHDLDISVLSELNNANENKNIAREKGVFRASLVEFASKLDSEEVDLFKSLVLGWNGFVSLFKRNFDTYLSGFAFQKTKMELAKAELSVAEQFSKILGEISGKILSIPLSFVAVVTYIGNNNSNQRFVIFIGVLIASLVISLMISNQKLQFERIVNAKNVIFSDLELKKKTYPVDIRNILDDTIKNLSKSEVKLKRLFSVFQIVSWTPTFCILFIFLLSK